MRNKHGEVSELKVSGILSIVTVVGIIVVAGSNQENLLRGAGTDPAPRVTAITQVTHDGYRKTNLLADDGQLFVTELPASNRVIARVSLPNSDRSLLRTPFTSLQALDISPDHSKLLVSSASKSSGENEFWTLPFAKGRPERVADLNGRDASWSADGKALVLAKGSVLYLADGAG